MRDEIRRLAELGPMPDSDDADVEVVTQYQNLLRDISRPITDEEARALVQVFGQDDCFGLAWTLLHAIETAPGWPLGDCLQDDTNPWVRRLRERAERGRERP